MGLKGQGVCPQGRPPWGAWGDGRLSLPRSHDLGLSLPVYEVRWCSPVALKPCSQSRGGRVPPWLTGTEAVVEPHGGTRCREVGATGPSHLDHGKPPACKGHGLHDANQTTFQLGKGKLPTAKRPAAAGGGDKHGHTEDTEGTKGILHGTVMAEACHHAPGRPIACTMHVNPNATLALLG